MKLIKDVNPKIWTHWSLCHVVSLIIKHGLLKIPEYVQLISKVKLLYDYFTDAIQNQLFEGKCDEAEVKCDSITNVIDKAFNIYTNH